MKTFPKIAAAFTFIFLYLPIVILVIFSFSSSDILGMWGGASLKWYRKLFQDRATSGALWTSIQIGLISGILSTAIAAMFAFAQQRFPLNRRWEKTITAGLFSILIAPEIVTGVSLLVLFGMIRLPLGFAALILAHTMLNLPLAWLILTARMKAIPKEWEEAAMDLGADLWTSVRRVTIPLLAPALVSSLLATFSYSFDDFVTSFFVSGPGSTTVPLKTYTMLRYAPSPEINALSTVLFFVPLTFVGLGSLLLFKKKPS